MCVAFIAAWVIERVLAGRVETIENSRTWAALVAHYIDHTTCIAVAKSDDAEVRTGGGVVGDIPIGVDDGDDEEDKTKGPVEPECGLGFRRTL